MICHGNGDPQADMFQGGCCWVNGQVCPNRLYISAGRVFNSNRNDLGTVREYVEARVNGRPKVDRAVNQLQGARYVCGVVADLIANDANLLTDRAALDAAWAAAPAYQPVADHWQSIGRPRGWCASFGMAEGQCCFGEDAGTNAARAAGLHAEAVTVRGLSTGAAP